MKTDTSRATREELHKAAHDAAETLGLKPRDRTVLEALVDCYGRPGLSGGFIACPSNAHLVEATGLSERTLQRAFLSLAEAEVIHIFKNREGRRFIDPDETYGFTPGYGFDLSLLYNLRHAFPRGIEAIEDVLRVAEKFNSDLLTIYVEVLKAKKYLIHIGRSDLIDSLRVGFETHGALAMRRLSSMTDAA